MNNCWHIPALVVCLAAVAGCADAPERATASADGGLGAGGAGDAGLDASDEHPGSAGAAGGSQHDGAPELPPIQRSLVRGASDWPQSGFNPANVFSSTARVTDLPGVLWKTPLDVGDLAYAVPVVGSGKLFVRLYNGGLAALDVRTGAVEWWVKDFGPGAGFDGKYGASAYEDGLVYTFAPQDATFSDNVIALDAATGSAVWIGPAVQSNGIKVSAGTVFVTTADAKLAALDAKTGAVRWSVDSGCVSAPAIEDQRICCVGNNALHAFHVDTGALEFEAPASYAVPTSVPAISDDRVYFLGDRLYAHSVSNGSLLWSAEIGFTTEYSISSPALAYGRVFAVGLDGSVRAFHGATGELLWTASGGGAGLIVADGRVIVGSSRVLDADTGELIAELPQDCMGWAAPVVIDGMVFSGREGDTTEPNLVCGISGPVSGEPME